MMNLTGGALGQLGWVGSLVVETGWCQPGATAFPVQRFGKMRILEGVAGIHGVEQERERDSIKQNEGSALFHQYKHMHI